MLDYKAVGRLPDAIRFTRNGRVVEASRMGLGEVHVRGRCLRIADSALVDAIPPLPIRPPDGEYQVYAYQWPHPRGVLNVCAVICFRPQRWALTRRLAVHNDIRPDLSEGVLIDSAEIAVRSADTLMLRSGLGDGYYPVLANYNYGIFPQSIVVDFKLWELRRVILRPGQEMDEYGIVRAADMEGGLGS